MNTDPLIEQAQAATTEARGMVAAALGLDTDRPTRGTSPLFEALWTAYAQAPRCEHLAARPVQPSLLLLPEVAWRCRPCLRRWGEHRRALGLTYGPAEENTCDCCRRYTPSGLTPTIVRQDLWLFILSLCHRCAQAAIEQGAKEIAP